MKTLTSHYKRLRFVNIKTTLLVLFFSTFFTSGIVSLEKTGNNYFHVVLNGTEVGVVGAEAEARRIFSDLRRQLAGESEELLLIDADLTCVGEEVLFGRLDAEKTLRANMEAAIRECIKKTKQRSFTVKVNEYMVNLSTMEEVRQLLQAAVDKYDTEQKFQAQITRDSQREFQVMTAQIIEGEARESDRAKHVTGDAYLEAGIQARFTKMSQVEKTPDQMDFSDYELGLLSMNFAEEIEITEAYLPENQVKSLEEAVMEVTKEQEKSTSYDVVAGDTLSEISIKVNIPMDTLIAMNENLEDENSVIRAGDTLIITIPEPELSIEREEVEYLEEIYDAPVEYVDNDAWYTTESVVLQQPSAGLRKIIARTSYLNETEADKEIVKEELVVAAVPKIVERGTKVPPTYIKPLSGGRFTSGFGRRTAPKRGASTYHKGVDWATPVGTAIFASSGGTVAKAGWGSGYGYVVYINHADGRQTRYGHLSKVLVSAGQTVKQGEKIALSGNSGVSTGPHLHFEILINGSQVDPMQYLN